jgi:hypothetical protein
VHILEQHPPMDWFEVISENFMVEGGRPLEVLEGVRARYPIVMHGVSLSIGSSDPLNRTYLDTLRAAARRFEPAWVSDHLCWTGVGGRNLHDLLPLPYTEETVTHVAGRIRQVQEILERTILIENVSSYMAFRSSQLEEWEFLTAVAEEADCAILLDFPATLAVVGTDNFAAIVKEYLLKHPPTEPSILYASLYLADFLNVHPFAERWPFIAELARLERAVLDVFHAADAPALSLEALRAIPSEKWPAVKLRAHPAVEIVHSEWRIADGLHTVEQG